MAVAAVIVPLVVAALGATVTAVGQYQQAKSDQDVLDSNAKIQLRNAYRRERAIRRRGELEIGRQRLAIAKAGVAATGSPLEQLARNAYEVEREAINTRHAGIAQYESTRAIASHIVSQARRGVVMAGFLGASQGAASGYALLGGRGEETGTLGGVPISKRQEAIATRRPTPYRTTP